MAGEQPATVIQARNYQASTRRYVLFFLFVAIIVLGIVSLLGVAYMSTQLLMTYGRSHLDAKNHFKYGSIGAELANGLPYRIFIALPKVFPEHFGLSQREADAMPIGQTAKAFRHFGFIVDEADEGVSKGLPVGFATGRRMGQEVAWFNCAVCHTGKVRMPDWDKPKIISGMPANTLNLEAFLLALFEMVVDKRFSWSDPTFRKTVAGDDLWWPERVIWEWGIVPYTRSVLIRRRSELLPLLDPKKAWTDAPPSEVMCKAFPEPSNTSSYANCPDGTNLEVPPDYARSRPTTDPTPWGPGRVDTFNPYKLIHFNRSADCLKPKERVGFTDYPSVFLQRPRGHKMMNLHWDGNNASLKERNLSAALGAGVSPETVRHRSIGRVAEWLNDLPPPKSPYRDGLDDNRIERGKAIYMRACATCHGYHDGNTYVFEGDRLGTVEDIEYIRTDRGRLDSYTKVLEKFQKDQLFCNQPEHRFKHFKKTRGYANMPLDALWLRAPYLHNGSVPTLVDLLKPESERPKAFLRGLVELDPANGGFKSPACDPSQALRSDKKQRELTRLCFDTTRPGNSNAGHTYGTDLPAAEKRDLLEYLLSF